jgi:two-component system, NtrC family, nitrogen regulation response regulator GlnG
MGTTVWVVDDEDAVRGVLEAMIRELGYQVRAFEKAQDVLDAMKDGSPDVVITDVRMPGMNGLELTRAMLEKDPGIIVMILTGFPSIPDAVETIRAGAVDFLSKPCRIEEIRIRLERALEGRRLQGRLRKARVVAWSLILSLPVWFVLGILLAKILQP